MSSVSSASSASPIVAARECVATGRYSFVPGEPLSQEEELQLQLQLQEEEAEYEDQLSSQRERRAEREHRLKELNAFWQKKVASLESEIGRHASHLQQKCHELEELDRPPEQVYPGPRWLRWVEGNWASLLASLVVVANLVVIAQEALRHECWRWLDRCFLVYFVVELALRGGLHQDEFLRGQTPQVCFNWLDLIVVVGGVLEVVLESFSDASETGCGVEVFKFMRVLRLARTLKLCGLFMRADMSWTERDGFQMFIMVMIFLSSLAMSFEIDFPDLPVWFYWEHFVLIVFSFEIVARMKQAGLWSFLFTGEGRCWNYFDTFLVCAGIMDEWLFPAVRLVKVLAGITANEEYNESISDLLRVLRILRLFRIMRLLRLIKGIPPLYNLLVGIARAMASMMWVMVLTSMMLYAWGLLTVALLRDGLVEVDCSTSEDEGSIGDACPFELDAHGEAGESIHPRCIFSSVTDTMLILFELMNGHMAAFEDLLACIEWIKPFLCLYMALSCLTILPTLTAVVSDNMLNSTRETKESNKMEADEALRNRRRSIMNELIDSIGPRKDGYIDKPSFDKLLKEPYLSDTLAVTAQLHLTSLKSLFDLLERGGQVHRNTFVRSLDLESKEVCEQTFMRFEKRISSIEANLSGLISTVTNTQSEVHWLTSKMCPPKQPQG